MSTPTAAPPRITSPKHPESVSLVLAITAFMDTKGITRAEIVAATHLNDLALDKKLKHQSAVTVRDFFAMARVLDMNPSSLIAAADNHR